MDFALERIAANYSGCKQARDFGYPIDVHGLLEMRPARHSLRNINGFIP
jgi:hypothetical protein